MTSRLPRTAQHCLIRASAGSAVDQLADTLARQAQQANCCLGERCAFGGALDFHQPARPGQHEIGVGLGGGVLVIVQVQHRLALDDAAAYRRDLPVTGTVTRPVLTRKLKGIGAARQSRR